MCRGGSEREGASGSSAGAPAEDVAGVARSYGRAVAGVARSYGRAVAGMARSYGRAVAGMARSCGGDQKLRISRSVTSASSGTSHASRGIEGSSWQAKATPTSRGLRLWGCSRKEKARS